MTTAIVIFVLIAFQFSCCELASVAYTIESTASSGKPCLTDCDEGKCWTAHNNQENCSPGWRKAPTYYTNRYRHHSITTCLSKCDFAGYTYSWCYVDQNYNWDYCSNDTTGGGKWYQMTKNNGRCRDKCSKRDCTRYLWCHTYFGSWDYCTETLYFQEEANTINGKKCYGDCSMHNGTYYWCYDEKEKATKCAPSAVRNECPSTRHRRAAPARTVAGYNQAIDQDHTLITVTRSTLSNPNDSPILDYTYRITPNGTRLPIRVRAFIRPRHYQGVNSRTSNAISSGARTNCNRMGMNRRLANYNNDQCGHLIPYIVGGSSDWWNIVPQTRRINVGRSIDVGRPSLWSNTERTVRRWVQRGGYVFYQVVVAYDLNQSTRPTGFGTIEQYWSTSSDLVYECPDGYWYSNHPYMDPNAWNDNFL